MISIFRNSGAVAIALALMTGSAFAGMAGAAGGGGSTNGAGMGAGADASVNGSTSVVPSDAAGSTGMPGAHGVTGAHTDGNGSVGASTMGKSLAELPNNDAGTPINNGPAGKPVGAPRVLVPGNNQ